MRKQKNKKTKKVSNTLRAIGRIFTYIIGLPLLLVALTLLIVFTGLGISELINTINPTIVSVIITSMIGVTTLLLSKRYENKLIREKDTRENKLFLYQEYLDFLLNRDNLIEIDLKELLKYHHKLILKVSDETINKMDNLVIAVANKNEDSIKTQIINIVYEFRKQVGYSGNQIQHYGMTDFLFEGKSILKQEQETEQNLKESRNGIYIIDTNEQSDR